MESLMESLIAPIFNFLILVAFLVYKLRDPLREFVKNRHDTIRDELHAVSRELQQAQEKYDEFSSKLKAIDSELVSMREHTQQDITAIKHRIISESRRLSLNIASEAKIAAEGLHLELKGQLYTEMCGKVLDRAESMLKEKLTGDDRVKIRGEFSKQLEAIQ
jgi:F-type H+-transporting ATPase subunit b